jgi:hypothetical protein
MLGGTANGPVLTVAQARQVFQAMWSLRNEAFSTENRGLLAEFETGPALEADEVTCACGFPSPRGPIIDESLLVPKATSFPATFLGEALTTRKGAPFWQYLVISRQSSSVPWMVVADPNDRGKGGLDAPPTGPGGFDVAQPPALATQRYEGDLAAYWRSLAETGRGPTGTQLAPGKWTTGAPANDLIPINGTTWSQNGLVAYQLFRAGEPADLWRFGTKAGGLTCGVVRVQRYWELPGGTLHQPQSQDMWGPTIAPGTYSAIVSSYIGQPCFMPSAGGKVSVIAGYLSTDTEVGLGWEPLPAATTTTTATFSTTTSTTAPTTTTLPPYAVILPATLPAGQVGAPYFQGLTADLQAPAGVTFQWSVLTDTDPPTTGLPPGIELTSPGGQSATLQGTPTSAGTYSFDVTESYSPTPPNGAPAVLRSYSLTIAAGSGASGQAVAAFSEATQRVSGAQPSSAAALDRRRSAGGTHRP